MHLAIRAMWVLGILLVVLGVCGMGGSLMLVTRGGAPGGMLVFQFLGAMFYWVPGIAYIACAIYLKRRRFWAVIAGLVVASVQFLFLLTGFVGLLVVYLLPHSDLPRAFAVVIGVLALFALALAQLVYYLARSFQAIQEPPYGREEHGFEPIVVGPAVLEPAPRNLPIEAGVSPAGDSDASSPPR
jgi:hypothetical protein